MRSAIRLFAALLVPGAALLAQPPLIDRELFFGDPEISGAQISPDGKYISFLKPWNKTRNLWVKRAQEPFSAARLVTADTKRPIPGYFWSRDSKFILFVQDQAGDENYNVYAVNPAEPPRPGKEVPEARNLTDAQGVRAAIYAVPRSQPDTIYVGLNDRDKAWHDLYKVNIATGERTLLRKNTDRVTGWIFDLKDQLRLATRSAENGDTEILRVDAEKLTKVYGCDVLETCAPVRFHKDNQRVYMINNTGDDIDLARLVLFDPASSKLQPVESDPLKRVDFGGPMFSEVSDELIATIYEDDRRRIYFKDKKFEADYRWLERRLRGREPRFGSRTRDERWWLISAAGDTEPGETYLFDRKGRQLTLQYRIREQIPRDALASMQAVRYSSSDGLEIPAFLTLPKGVPAKGLPAILLPHGGPWARDSWGYDGLTQFLANRGYAVLSPNFRGSTGYGKKFLNAGNKQWGDRMQDDITWGARYLVEKGIADPKRIGILGGSYGGYATLAGVAFTPDLYAAAVSIVGPSNLITLLESIPPYWEAVRKMFHVRMGDPTTPEGRKQLERQSPLNSAQKIRTPLLVIQGANDPRVNKQESDQIVVALRDRGFPVEYLVAPDEGHGFARPVNSLAMFTAAEKFLARHLGGRFQEGATEEVAARLAEITVDPKTVVLARKLDAGAVGLPRPVLALVASTDKYKANIRAGERSIDIRLETTLREEAGAWVATDSMSGPMGEVTDTAVLAKDTLAVARRSIRQGPVSVEIDFRDNKASGKINVGGQEKPIEADLGGPLFADAAGAGHSIAALPLAEGYSTTFRNFDVQRQKVKLMQLRVAGTEQVTVPAGAFEAFKVEITSADGGPDKVTMWIAREPRRVVKVASALPQMGGATLTAELTQ